jgi:hypothetical protein
MCDFAAIALYLNMMVSNASYPGGTEYAIVYPAVM